jgi:hypothetical protein
MGTRDWLSGWNAGAAQVLAEAETATARAALVDTNGDGRELWFGLDVLSPEGEWVAGLDWDDVDTVRLPERLDGADVVYGWGNEQDGRTTAVEYGDSRFIVRVGRNGWWLLLDDQFHA